MNAKTIIAATANTNEMKNALLSSHRSVLAPAVRYGCCAGEGDTKALKAQMYRHPRVRVMGEAESILFDLFARYQNSPHDLPPEWLR